MTSFEDYKKDRPKRGQGCAVCGKPTEGRLSCICRGEREEAPPVPDRDCPVHGDKREASHG